MGYYRDEIEQGKPPGPLFDGDKVLQEDELARRLRSNDSTDRQSQVDPSKPENETKPEQNRASDQPPGSGSKIRSYDDFMDKLVEDSMVDTHRRNLRDDERRFQREREEEMRVTPMAAERELQYKLEAERMERLPSIKEHSKTNSKSWSKYLPW